MSVSRAKLTVYFDDPFWAGLYERWENGGYQVSKITFGGEPRDYEVLEFLTRHWRDLKFSPALAIAEPDRRPNPKRLQREARQATRPGGTGTKAQQAMQLQREQMKTERNIFTREQREAEQERKFVLRQQKRREKHRGR